VKVRALTHSGSINSPISRYEYDYASPVLAHLCADLLHPVGVRRECSGQSAIAGAGVLGGLDSDRMKKDSLRLQAIEYIKEDIKCHKDWAAYIRAHPRKVLEPVKEVDAVGHVSHHRRWIRRLNVVLKALTS